MGFPSPLLLGQILHSPDSAEPCSNLGSLSPQTSASFPSLPLPAFSPSHSVSSPESVPLPLSFANSRSLSLSSSLCLCLLVLPWFSHLFFSGLSLSLCVDYSPYLSLSFSLSLSPYPLPPNSAVSTSPNFNCLNCLFCGWAVIKRYLGYSPLGLRSGLPGSSDHKGHSWVE